MTNAVPPTHLPTLHELGDDLLFVTPLRRRGGFGREMSGLMLLGQKSVQEELKLGEQQVADVKKASESNRETMREVFSKEGDDREELVKKARTDAEEAVSKIVSADQAKRLGEIRLQVRGASATASDETSKALGLSDEQKNKSPRLPKSFPRNAESCFETEEETVKRIARS